MILEVSTDGGLSCPSAARWIELVRIAVSDVLLLKRCPMRGRHSAARRVLR